LSDLKPFCTNISVTHTDWPQLAPNMGNRANTKS